MAVVNHETTYAPEKGYDILPPSYATRTDQPVDPILISYPFMRKNYSTFNANECPWFEFCSSGLRASTLFIATVANAANQIQLPENSPLYSVLCGYRKIAFNAASKHYSGRTVIQSCARAFCLIERALVAHILPENYLERHAKELHGILENCRLALENVPDNMDDAIPPSFVNVTMALNKWLDQAPLPRHFVCTVDLSDHVAGDDWLVPVVIHPALDLTMESLQQALMKVVRLGYNQHTVVVAFEQCLDAFDRVNTALLSNPKDAEEKARAFRTVINEFHRLYARHLGLSKSDARWIAITLIGPKWRRDFKELCGYLEQSVERITGDPWKFNIDRLEAAITRDVDMNARLWTLNLQLAAQVKCINPRTCEALRMFPQWVRVEVQEIRDVPGGIASAEEAWKLLQKATPGTYEHRALMYALYELRRKLFGELEEWEFLESEISTGKLIGEGGFAGVHMCTWLSGVAAVKFFKERASNSGTALTTQDFNTYLHRREREVWFRLSHPHILPFLGSCTTGPTPMILTPLAEHGNARTYRGEHPDADWMKILAQICSGVNYLHHEVGIVHGDLKGNNILIVSNHSPMITDFGLAKMTQNIYGHQNLSGGTAQWMAPELLNRTGFLTYESDIYALGMTLYELWFDKDPFDMLESDLVVEMVVEEHATPIREDSPPLQDWLWDLMRECWDGDLSARPTGETAHAMMISMTSEDEADVSSLDASNLATVFVQEAAELDQEISVENLKCTVIHEAAIFPDREDFPFISAGHLISFAVRRERGYYPAYKPPKGLLHVETTQDGIQRSPGIEHPVERVIFRIQSMTRHHALYSQPGSLGCPSRFHAVLLRRLSISDGSPWVEVPEARHHLFDGDEHCDASMAHVVMLGPDSPIARQAVAGDKVALEVTVDWGYELTMKTAEIEMHVQLAAGHAEV